MLYDVFIQGLGILAFIIGVSAFLSKDDRQLKFLIATACFIVATHFLLIGAYVGAGAAALGGTRSFISIFQSAKPYAPVFFLAYIPLGYFCIYDWIDILPIIAGLIGTYSMFYLKAIPMRYGLFMTSSLWLIHNVLQGSIGPALLEIFYLGANARTIYGIKKAEEDITSRL